MLTVIGRTRKKDSIWCIVIVSPTATSAINLKTIFHRLCIVNYRDSVLCAALVGKVVKYEMFQALPLCQSNLI